MKARTRTVSRSDSIIAMPTPGPPAVRAPLDRQVSRVSISNSNPTRAPKVSIFGVVLAKGAWKRLSQRKRSVAVEKPKVKLENTYRLGPEPEHVFKPDLVRGVIEEVLTSFLKTFKYTAVGAKQMSTTIAAEVKMKVKRLGYPRYKIVVGVIIMQNKGQGSQVASRSVWNAATDSYASYTLTTNEIVAIGNVHGVYFE